jgi:hypothetical protein
MTSDAIQKWFDDATEAGWDGLEEIRDAAIRVHGAVAGLWRCDACDCPLLDPAVSGAAGCTDESEAVMLYGDITLCRECHDAAQTARAKIVVIEDDEAGVAEDDSALTDDERTMAAYLSRAESARNYADRGLIGGYPRDEQRQLHRYQDQIEADRFRSGKQQK